MTTENSGQERITISMQSSETNGLDRIQAQNGFPSRSETIRKLVEYAIPVFDIDTSAADLVSTIEQIVELIYDRTDLSAEELKGLISSIYLKKDLAREAEVYRALRIVGNL